MPSGRRDFIVLTSVAALALALPGCGGAPFHATKGPAAMYGLIGKMKATPGQRDALIALLLDDVGEMPGCLNYIVARDPKDADAIWISEVWDSADSHRASLSLPKVRAAIERAKPMIAGFEAHFETEPVGGVGLGP
ncbi:putative quinol monooxygenase [Lysobacter sp. CA199]|uniref:putative quinol monooxygenase n=1 Tax=Lysobacter sp. CA199 TaxID=3455608 RepID=UPI003F8D7668